MCAETILAAAIKCKHCGHALDDDAENRSKSDTLGYLLALAPLASAALMYFWIGNMRLIQNPMSTLHGILIGTIIATVLLAVADSAVLKVKGGGSVIATMLLMWVVGYPFYLGARARFGGRSLLVVGILSMLVMLGVYAYLYSAVDAAMDHLEQTRRQLEQGLPQWMR
jgi:hypothetical protein